MGTDSAEERLFCAAASSAPLEDKLPDHPLSYDPEFPIGDLRLFHKNPRKGDVERIKTSLKVNKQYRAICVNIGTHTGRPNEVLAGNHTVMAARSLGLDTIAVNFVDVDDDQCNRIVAVDNRTSDVAVNDTEVLAELLEALDSLEGTGYSDDELETLLAGEEQLPEEGDADEEELAETWGVIVMCHDENAQVELLARLKSEGLNVRALVT